MTYDAAQESMTEKQLMLKKLVEFSVGVGIAWGVSAAALAVSALALTGNVTVLRDVVQDSGGDMARMAMILGVLGGMTLGKKGAVSTKTTKTLKTVMAATLAMAAGIASLDYVQTAKDKPVTAFLTEAEYAAQVCKAANLQPGQSARVKIDGASEAFYCGVTLNVGIENKDVLSGLKTANGQPARKIQLVPNR